MQKARRALVPLLATSAVILGACGGGGSAGPGNDSAATAGAGTQPASAQASPPVGYVQGYTLSRVGWYTYDADHSTTPLIANVQTSLSESGAVAGYYTIEACADCAYTEATDGTPSYSGLDDYCMGHDGRMACPSQDTAINATGTTAGAELMGYPAYDPYSAIPVHHAYAAGVDLGTLGGSSSYATGINAAGQAVGYSDLPGNTATQAFLSSQGIMSALVVPGSVQSWATAINEHGQVAGSAIPAGDTLSHGFLYSSGSYRDLGPGQANAINAGGQVAGTNRAGAFLSLPGSASLQWLGAGSAVGVNAAGQVVINGAVPSVWDGSAPVDLNTIIAPGDPLAGSVTLTAAIAINDSGQILVRGHDRKGWQMQFLMTPPSIADQLATLQRMLQGTGSAIALAAHVTQVQGELAAGNPAAACRELSAAATCIATDEGHDQVAGSAGRLITDVHVMMSTLACPY